MRDPEDYDVDAERESRYFAHQEYLREQERQYFEGDAEW